MAAASSGSARVLRAILDKANIADELMMPIRMHALHEAAKNGHLEVIQVVHANNNTLIGFIAHSVVTLHLFVNSRCRYNLFKVAACADVQSHIWISTNS